jgi:putative oxidoreductase
MSAFVSRIHRLAENVGERLRWLPPSAARLTLGWVFLESGWGKLHDLDKVIDYFTSLGIPAPRFQAPLVAAVEFGCGGLVLAGLATRLAAVPLIAVMLVALSTALRERIESLSDVFGLAEFCYVILLLGLIVHGPGPLSLDALLGRRRGSRT